MAGLRSKPLKSGCFQAWYIDRPGTGLYGRGMRVFFTGTAKKSDTLKAARRFENEEREIRLGLRNAHDGADRLKSKQEEVARLTGEVLKAIERARRRQQEKTEDLKPETNLNPVAISVTI